ncbi:hypothetical protein MBLNU230_g5254t1 [Neophaeotheca triangularis]
MATIKPIEGQSVHQIQSGQVIVDLNSVVKELVENSLDAGASSIEVRFKNHGLDSIEVQDNGKGISPDDYETVALKHHTSKLSSYEDLTGLDTFGFRGEALSSLCALSKFFITTARADDGARGKKLEFESSGKLRGTSIVAAQRGTTVTVENLFCTLPVRRKELEKNIKREYSKVLSLLQAYACISTNVRLSISNQMPKGGKKVPIFSTKSNTTTKENITNVFGAKTLLALVKLDLHLEMSPNQASTQSARSWSTQAANRSRDVHVQGHISRPVFGEGRQAPDRQMFFVNSRPCGLPQVAKAFNEIYKSFNVSQSPFVFANLVMDTNAYDVNVSPDKRTIMLHDQGALLESLKLALTELFEDQAHTVPLSQLPSRKLPSFKPPMVSRRETAEVVEEEEDEEQDEEGEDGGDGDEEGIAASRSTRRPSGTPGNLIHSWFGRDTEDRKIPRPPKRKAGDVDQGGNDDKLRKEIDNRSAANEDLPEQGDNETPGGQTSNVDVLLSVPSINKQTLASSSSGNRITALQEPDPLSSPYDDLFSQRPPLANPAVQTPRIDDGAESPDSMGGEVDNRVEPNHLNPATEQPGNEEDEENEKAEDQDSTIPSTTPSSQKLPPGTIQNAFDRMRPKRTPLQTAEITIGDKTTSTVLGGSSSFKKRRIHEPVNSQAIGRFGSSPLLTSGLRGFAAPGSQVESEGTPGSRGRGRLDGEVAESGGEEEEEESEVEGQGDEEDGGDVAMEDGEDGSNADGESKDSENTADATEDENGKAVAGDEVDDDALLAEGADDESDENYVDEDEKRLREDEKVARLIQEAEDAAARPTDQNLKLASQMLKNGNGRKESTLNLSNTLRTSIQKIEQQATALTASLRDSISDAQAEDACNNATIKDEIDDTNAETRLSLTVAKEDFARMTIVGQFNLGFILAIRPARNDSEDDELFIIDQHAADEKYNYERLQRTVTLQSQRLARPKLLDLTAIEEEIIANNASALKANGFEIATTPECESESRPQHHLLTLPMSKEKTFDLSDLEELLHLLSETPSPTTITDTNIPRPRKVQRLLAMRACRSSVMVGRTLTLGQMRKVVGNMGGMEKPWNCPHGRPTMRHLAGLGSWGVWREGDGVGVGGVEVEDEVGDGNGEVLGGLVGRREDGGTDWKGWLGVRAE